MFIFIINLANILTFFSLVLSTFACYLALNEKIEVAIILFILVGICDLFDGLIARKFNKSEQAKSFGIQLDSIVDVVNFGVVPTIIMFASGLNQIYDYAIFSFYILAAANRLAYFNTLALKQKLGTAVKYYTGLPVTYSALIFSLAWLFKTYMDTEVYLIFLRIVMLTVAVLFISRLKILKPKGIFYLIFPLIAVIVTVLYLMRLGILL